MPNGSKVDWKSLHEELAVQSRERAEMERRLVEAIAEGCQGIRDELAKDRMLCSDRFTRAETDIVALKVADRRWGGLVGLFAAGISGLGAWFANR